MQGKIALEEHFAIPETLMDSAGFVPDSYWPELKERLLDIQDKRLAQMDQPRRRDDDPFAERAGGSGHSRHRARQRALQSAPMISSPSKWQNARRGFRRLPRCRCRIRISRSRSSSAASRRSASAARWSTGSRRSATASGRSTYDLPQYWPFWAAVEKTRPALLPAPAQSAAGRLRDLRRTSVADGPDLGVRTGDGGACVAPDGFGPVRCLSETQDHPGPHGRRPALQHVARRSSQRLGQGAAEAQGEEEDLRLLQRQLLPRPLRAISAPKR